MRIAAQFTEMIFLTKSDWKENAILKNSARRRVMRTSHNYCELLVWSLEDIQLSQRLLTCCGISLSKASSRNII
jgi:hypothetical protein